MGADLGPTSKATVYAAELLGILYYIITVVTTRNVESATLFVDNQAAIQSVHSPGGQSGQLILRQIIHFISILLAHTGIPGNGKADIIANKPQVGELRVGQGRERLSPSGYANCSLRVREQSERQSFSSGKRLGKHRRPAANTKPTLEQKYCRRRGGSSYIKG
jgi:hypothetical protein